MGSPDQLTQPQEKNVSALLQALETCPDVPSDVVSMAQEVVRDRFAALKALRRYKGTRAPVPPPPVQSEGVVADLEMPQSSAEGAQMGEALEHSYNITNYT
jgi:hypothetical protein